MSVPNTWILEQYFNITITNEDYVRFGSNLRSWLHLNELLILDQFSVFDLKKLLILEVAGQRRQQVMRCLLSKIKTKESKHVKALLGRCLSVPPTVPDQAGARRTDAVKAPSPKRKPSSGVHTRQGSPPKRTGDAKRKLKLLSLSQPNSVS